MDAFDLLFNEKLHEKYRNRARIASISFLVLVFILLFLPLMSYPDPPPGQEGVLISFGDPDVGAGVDDPALAETDEAAEPDVEETAEDTDVEEVVDEPEVIDEPKEEAPSPTPDRDVLEDERAKELALQKQKKKEADAKKRAEEEARKKAEAEAKRKAEEAARKKAEEEARRKAEAEKKKDQVGDLFNRNNGDGRGNNGTPGNQGDPNGGDSDILEGISTGSGRVGGGLSNRGGRGKPITANFQEAGIVVVDVCIDDKGRVLSAKYTQSGSNTNSPRLIKLAEDNAKRDWSFKAGATDKVCGTITYNFKVK